MVPFCGDYNTTETVIIPFNTFTSDDPTASATITNLVAGDIEIHKDGSVTQRASDSGVSVTIDFGSVTGNHLISIDLSDNTDSGFYSTGSRYQVRIEGTTVDGGTINAWLGSFSIGCTLRPSVDGRTIGVGADGDLLEVNTLTGHTAQTGDSYSVVNSGTFGNSALKSLVDTVDTVVDSVKAVTDLLPEAGALTSLATSAALATIDTNVGSLITRLTAARAGYLDKLNVTGIVSKIIKCY